MWRCGWVLVLLYFTWSEFKTAAEKRSEDPMPFVLGSRYGRSLPKIVAPRNDRIPSTDNYAPRFFMGSRYGKRSELPMRVPATPDVIPLFCHYTGIQSYFCCIRKRGTKQLIPEKSEFKMIALRRSIDD